MCGFEILMVLHEISNRSGLPQDTSELFKLTYM